jgi:hypothetical protein
MMSKMKEVPPVAGPEMRPDDPEYMARYQRAQARVHAIRDFFTHLGVYLVVNLFLFGINMVSNSSSLWFYWPLMGWGVAVAIHAVVVFGPLGNLSASWEERKIREYMEYMEKDR